MRWARCSASCNQHAWIEQLGYRRYLAVCMFAFALGGVGAALCDSSMQLTLVARRAGLLRGRCSAPLPVS